MYYELTVTSMKFSDEPLQDGEAVQGFTASTSSQD